MKKNIYFIFILSIISILFFRINALKAQASFLWPQFPVSNVTASWAVPPLPVYSPSAFYNPFYYQLFTWPYSRQPLWSFPSSPSPLRYVPRALGLTRADAEYALASANLRVGSINIEHSATVPVGLVISQDPVAGILLPINSVVHLVISSGPQEAVALKLIAEGFTTPVVLTSSYDNTGRLFIADQTGVIRILTAEGELLEEPFLDLRTKMVSPNEQYDERGLLGLAFHPDFINNGLFFVYYSAPLRENAPAGWDHTSRIAEFSVSGNNPMKADVNSERIILEIDQPQFNHNGGQIVFGPDGYLYIPLGDGGGANDQDVGHGLLDNGQNINNLLGSILRIDVDHGIPYAIPPQNPFINGPGLDEMFAFGFRNPFRISFDLQGIHDLFVADVGQNLWEEVNIVTPGNNYGWNVKEGTHCFNPENPQTPPNTCSNVGPNGFSLIDPILEYQNSNVTGGLGRAIIGGFVYRGSNLPNLFGKYIFGDWSTSINQPDGSLLMANPPPIANALWPIDEILISTSKNGRLGKFVVSFGQDEAGELYVLTTESLAPTGTSGKIYMILPPNGSVPFITAHDQIPDQANMVNIKIVAYSAPGWIVIHDDSGAILGRSALVPGINLDIPVTLNRDVLSDETLHAMIHEDNQVIGTFEFPGPDKPVFDPTGTPIIQSFSIISPAPPTSVEPDINDVSPPTTQTTVSFSDNVQPIFDNSCTQCHRSGGIADFLSLMPGESYDALVNIPATRTGTPPSGIRVIPFNSSDSILYQRISNQALPDGENTMPPTGQLLSPQEQGIIRLWIDEGALSI
ncbi:MAG: PQQ-dependent sugar dehydrogenase [bacterium]